MQRNLVRGTGRAHRTQLELHSHSQNSKKMAQTSTRTCTELEQKQVEPREKWLAEAGGRAA